MKTTRLALSAQTVQLSSSKAPNKERRHNMFYKLLAALAVAMFTFGFVGNASAAVPCNQCGQYSTPADIRNCMSNCTKAPLATTATATTTATQPPPKTTKTCPGGKVIPVDQDCPAKEGPKTKKCWDNSVVPIDKDCPPPKGGDPKCGANEVVKDGACVCVEGFEKVCNACVAVCPEGQVHDGTGKCVEVGGTCEDPCEGAAADRAEIKKLIGAADHFWLLVAILLGVFGHLGWHLWLVYGRKSTDDESKPKAKPEHQPEPEPDEFETEEEGEGDQPKPEPETEPEPAPRRRPRRHD